MIDKIRWGIIGCGDVTEVKSGPAFNLVDGSTLEAVMRRDSAKAQSYAERHGVPKWYDNAGDLLNDPGINAVYIATPPSSHKEYALTALSKGLPVYIEKPVALNAGETKEIAEAAKRFSGKVSVAHYRRALPMFQSVKKILEEKTIGTVRMAHVNLWQPYTPPLIARSEKNWRTDPAISGGGLFHDLSPHLLDLMLYYFGSPVSYRGFSLHQSARSAADDVVSGQIIFNHDIVFDGLWNFSVGRTESRDECEIVGDKGKITFSLFGNDVAVRTETGTALYRFDHPKHIQQPMIDAVTQYFRGKGENPSSLETGLTVMQIIDSFTAAKR